MTQIGLFFGTQTGNTETLAETIQSEFGGDGVVTIHDIADASPDDFAESPYLIIGCPTWNIGEPQSDWEGFFDELPELTGDRIKTWVTQLKSTFGI